MHGRYGSDHDLLRKRIGGATVQLLEQIRTPDDVVYVMQEAIDRSTDPITLQNLAHLIRSGKTCMDQEKW